MKIEVPIRIESVANISEHWQAKAKRTREHRTAVWYALRAAKAPHSLPCTVTMTRVAPRSLDSHDNLRSAIKASADGVADWLDVKDKDDRITWAYAQRRGEPKTYALEIEITTP